MAATFQYSPLSGTNEIRVLKIHPFTDWYEPIRCDLEIVDIDDAANYAALSYSWGMNEDGDTGLVREITIDGKVVQITQNLFEALRRIRAAGTILQEVGSRLWVDAICINQADDEERTQQVSNMAAVYRCAKTVLIWLGEKGDTPEEDAIAGIIQCLIRDHHEAMQDCSVWANMLESHSVCSIWTPLTLKEKYIAKATVDGALEIAMDHDPAKLLEAAQLSALFRSFLLSRRYFTRRWIIREMYHANKETATVIWGNTSWPYIYMIHIVDELQGIDKAWTALKQYDVPGSQYGYYDKAAWGKLGELRTLLLHTSYNTIADIAEFLVCASRLDCSDPRDALFAILSLSKGTMTCDIKPDYQATAASVYTHFAKHMIDEGFSSLVLNNLRIEQRRSQSVDLGLPSWVPDLRAKFFELDGATNGCGFLRDDVEDGTAVSVDSNNVFTYNPYYLGTVVELYPEDAFKYQRTVDQHEFNCHDHDENVLCVDDGELSDMKIGDVLCCVALGDRRGMRKGPFYILQLLRRIVGASKYNILWSCPVAFEMNPGSRFTARIV